MYIAWILVPMASHTYCRTFVVRRSRPGAALPEPSKQSLVSAKEGSRTDGRGSTEGPSSAGAGLRAALAKSRRRKHSAFSWPVIKISPRPLVGALLEGRVCGASGQSPISRYLSLRLFDGPSIRPWLSGPLCERSPSCQFAVRAEAFHTPSPLQRKPRSLMRSISSS